MSSTRFINCEVCQTEGRILRSNGGPDDIDYGVCPACNGERVVEVETEPVTPERIMAQIPVPEHEAYKRIIEALSPLKPEERVTLMDWVNECYCPNCGFPAPPSDEDCENCKTIVYRWLRQ